MKPSLFKVKIIQQTCFAAGLLLLIAGAVGGVLRPHVFFISYLVAFIFWFGLVVGCLTAAMLHHLVGGDWGNVTRRFFEAGFMTLPFMLVLFVPLLFGLHELYPWTHSELLAADPILRQKAAYENVNWFALRALFFFAVLLLIACALRKWSLAQDITDYETPTIKLRTLSGAGIIIVPFIATFAFVDWIMSIEPDWFSTIFAVILMTGEILAAFSFAVILLAALKSQPIFSETVVKKHFLDLGNLLLTFVMFWTYVSFSQFLIIYSGNQPHEIEWYLHRTAGNWRWLGLFIALFHFFAPFFALLFRAAKQNTRTLALIAALLFCVEALAVYWMIAPTFYPARMVFHWTDFVVWFGMGGLWLAVFLLNLGRHPLKIKALSAQAGPVVLANEE